VYAAKGNISDAIKLCQDSLLIGQKNDAEIVVAGGYYALSELYLRLGDFDEALAYCERSITYYEEIDKNNFVFRTKVLAVVCKVYLGRYDEAKREADYLMELFESSENAYDNLPASVYLRNTIGFMAFRQEDYISAEHHWQEAHRQNSMVGAPDAAASIGNNLGMVYTNLDEYEAAEDILVESLSLYNQLGDVHRWANCMDNLADLYEKMGDWEAFKHTLGVAIGRLEPAATMTHSQKLLGHMRQRLEKFQDN
jgi:tetratricopeptide (TPR) repeat protein